jgi:Fe-S-cluster containining protein
MRFEYPAELRFQCTKCGLCCGDTKKKTRHILLLTAEAEQIATATAQPIPQFAAKTKGKTPYTHEMKKTPENGKCVFLAKNCCTIYPIRPLICRFYPFELKSTNQKYQFHYTNECPSIGKGKTLRKSYFDKLLQLARNKTTTAPIHQPFPTNHHNNDTSTTKAQHTLHKTAKPQVHCYYSHKQDSHNAPNPQ